MKTILLFFLLVFLFSSGNAQNKISFTYDAAGNQNKRVIVLATKSSISANDSVMVYTDIIAERNIKIYPNPTDGFLKLEIGNTENIKNCTITINHLNSGRQILRQKATLPVTTIDISNQSSGMYIMVIDIDGEYTSWKILKK